MIGRGLRPRVSQWPCFFFERVPRRVSLIGVVAACGLATGSLGFSIGSLGGQAKSPAQPNGATAYRPIQCRDLPVSSSLIDATSCWQAGHRRLLLAGRSHANLGSIVAVLGTGQPKYRIVRGARTLKIVSAQGSRACLEEGPRTYRLFNIATAQIGGAGWNCASAPEPRGAATRASSLVARTMSVGLGPCTGLTIAADPTDAVVGSDISVSASVDCPAGGEVSVEFRVEAPGSSLTLAGSGWTSSVSWTWDTGSTPAGAYEIIAGLTDGATASGPQDTAQAQVLLGAPVPPLAPCGSATVSLNSASVQPGDALSVSAASVCPDGTPVELAYIVVSARTGAWLVSSAWTTDTSWNWTPASASYGSYDLLVWATDGSTSNGPQAQAEAAFQVVPPPLPDPCSGVTLSSSGSSTAVGVPITVTADAVCPTGTTPTFAYIVEPLTSATWITASAWTSGATWSWTPSNAGAYRILVWLTDSSTSAGPQAESEVWQSVAVAPTSSGCTGLSAAASTLSGQTEETISLTATATCPGGTSPQFAYIVEPAGSNSWITASAWTASTSWSWEAAGAPPGQYDLLIWETSGATSAGPQDQAEVLVQVALPPTSEPCGSASIAVSVGDVQAGGSVSVSAVSVCPTGSTANFAYIVEAADASSWLTASAWTGSSWTWGTAGVAPGAYIIMVWTTDGALNGPQAVAQAQVEVTALPAPQTPCSGLRVSATPSSGLEGMTVSIGATVTCPSSAYLAYSVSSAAGGAPITTTAWTSTTWTWSTSGVAAGPYLLSVYLTDDTSALTTQAAQEVAQALIVVNPSLVPPSTASYYEFGAYAGECPTNPGAAAGGCPLFAQGEAQPDPGPGGLVVLDFGAPCTVPGTSPAVPGTQLFAASSCTPDSTLTTLVEDWIAGYESVAGRGPVTVAAGTSNSLTGVDNGYLSDSVMTTLGTDWFTQVVQPAAAWASTRSPTVSVWAASDLEQSTSTSGGLWQWDTGENSMHWVFAYNQAAQATIAGTAKCSLTATGYLADYGDDTLMDPATDTNNGWTATWVYQAAWGLPSTCALPEIYYSSMATEWAALSSWAQAQGNSAIKFTGVMGEPNPLPELCTWASPCSPTQGYMDLAAYTAPAPSPSGLTQITSALALTAEAAPSVSEITPAQGSPGAKITIYGTDLADVQGVYFGSALSADFYLSGSTIVATAPAQPPGVTLASIRLVTSNGSSPPAPADLFTYG